MLPKQIRGKLNWLMIDMRHTKPVDFEKQVSKWLGAIDEVLKLIEDLERESK